LGEKDCLSLVRDGDIIYDKHNMNREFAGRFRRNMMIAAAALLMLSPGSASVLCIAPGGHVAIEDLNAPCCESSHTSSPAKKQPLDRFAAAGDCNNCVDLLMTLNEWSVPIESSRNAFASAFIEIHFENDFSAFDTSGLFLLGAFGNVNIPAAVSSSAPLRC
jgi:hypothetical protein